MKISQKKILVLLAFAVICMLSLTAVSSASETIPSESDLLISDGVSVKMEDLETNAGTYVAIRFLFKWDAAATNDYAAANSLTPVKVGLVACSEAYYNAIEGDHSSKLVQLLEDNTSKVVKNDVAVYENGEMILKGKFLADGTDSAKGIYRYSYTLYNIPKANYDDEIYAATYILWSDDTYTLVSLDYSVVADTSVPGEKTVAKNTISLYDTTLGLFKQGLINSEKAEAKYLFDVLNTQKVGTSDESGTNSRFIYLPDNIDGGYVLMFYSTTIGTASMLNGSGANPAFSDSGDVNTEDSVSNNRGYCNFTNTIVVDYGVTGVVSGAEKVFTNNTTWASTNVTTVVYPSGFNPFMFTVGEDETVNARVYTTEGKYLFYCLSNLKKVIWCHLNSSGDYVEHGTDISLSEDDASSFASVYSTGNFADFRGFGAHNYKNTYSGGTNEAAIYNYAVRTTSLEAVVVANDSITMNAGFKITSSTYIPAYIEN